MNRARLAPLLMGALLLPIGTSAQIPIAAPVAEPPLSSSPPLESESAVARTFIGGSLEIQMGVAGIVLPEASRGMLSAQPELRVGLFLGERTAVQAELSARVWPLGTIAASSYGITGNFLWFPGSSASRARLFLLAGGGGALADPPGLAEGSSFDPLVRGGIGVRVPLAGLGVPFLDPLTFAAEYRGELVFPDESDFVSGISLGISRFL